MEGPRPDQGPHPRIAVAVEPSLLGDAIAEVLTHDGLDEVVREGQLGSDRLTAAVVTIVLPDEPGADVVIELPDSLGNTGVGRVRTASGVEPVVFTGISTILELLDRYCPGPSPRLAS